MSEDRTCSSEDMIADRQTQAIIVVIQHTVTVHSPVIDIGRYYLTYFTRVLYTVVLIMNE